MKIKWVLDEIILHKVWVVNRNLSSFVMHFVRSKVLYIYFENIKPTLEFTSQCTFICMFAILNMSIHSAHNLQKNERV